MKNYLIVDIGTSSLRVYIMDDSLQITDCRTESRVAPECFDAEGEWEKIHNMINSLLKMNKNVCAAAVSALLGWVGTDENGNAVTPCCSYMHKCEGEYSEFKKNYTDDEIYPICGRGINPEWAAFKILNIQRHKPEIYKKLRYFMTLKDFINFKLTGVAAVDRTSAGYSMLFDVKKGEWSEECIKYTGVDRKLLPQLKYPWEKLGNIDKKLADEFKVSFPVVTGSVDGSTGILGAGGIEAGTMVSVMGTTDTCFTVSDAPCGDEKQQLLVNAHVVPNRWLLGGPMGMYGGTVDWLRKKIAEDTKDINELNRLAAVLLPGSGGVSAFPTLAGEREPFWNPKVVGTFFGMTPQTRTEHIFRSIMEANSYAIRYMKELCGACNVPVKKMTAIGGGSKSELWLQIKADVLGIDVYRMEVSESTAAGSCMLAMLAVGEDINEIKNKVKPIKKFEFNKETHEIYNDLYDKYMKLHTAVTNTYEAL